MKIIFQILSYTGLVLTLFPSIFYFIDKITLDQVKLYMMIGMFLWFATSIFWLGKKSKTESD